ncbi:NUDIX domain-containing protein [Oerskovia sp. M15]
MSGILEPGEGPAVGLAREVLEETGVAVHVVALTGVTVTPAVEYPNGDRSQYLDLCFLCRPISPLRRRLPTSGTTSRSPSSGSPGRPADRPRGLDARADGPCPRVSRGPDGGSLLRQVARASGGPACPAAARAT